MAEKIRLKGKWKILIVLLLLFGAIQFIRPQLDNPPVTAMIQAPPDVMEILNRACFDCHSNYTQLQWFDQIAPANWLAVSDTKKARKALNFTEWNKLTVPQQKSTLYLAVNQVLYGRMPLSQYVLLHPDAKLSASDKAILREYLTKLTLVKVADTAHINAGRRQYEQWIHNGAATAHVQPAPNGIQYIGAYKNWKAISTTDRFDNGTLRVIFGNEIAVKAIAEHKINPWPNGTVFAKVAWDKLLDSSGTARTGAFKQVEFMIKDSKQYAATDGWGWARWLGMELKPYGKNALFATECQDCHQPMKDHDFVFTKPLNLQAR